MPGVPMPLDADDIIKRYVAGISMKAIYLSYGVQTSKRIRQLVSDAGIPIRNGSAAASLRMARMTSPERKTVWGNGKRNTTIDHAELVAQYVAGASENKLATQYGVTPKVIDRILLENGVQPRSQSEAERLKIAQMTTEQREQMVAPMRKAIKEGYRGPEWRINQALSKQRSLSFVGQGEYQLAKWMRSAGLAPVPQLAVDRYNIDLAILPVAVELFMAAGNPLRRAKEKRRTEYFMNRGIHVLYIVPSKAHPISANITNHIIAFLEEAKSDPSPIGQYRVIRGCGELMATGRGQVNDISLKPSPYCPFYRREVRYWSRRKKTIHV